MPVSAEMVLTSPKRFLGSPTQCVCKCPQCPVRIGTAERADFKGSALVFGIVLLTLTFSDDNVSALV